MLQVSGSIAGKTWPLRPRIHAENVAGQAASTVFQVFSMT